MKTPQDLQPLADLVTADTLAEYQRQGYTVSIQNGSHVASVTVGKKYARIDRNGSGFLMVDMDTGEIFGIKGYGVPHKGHRYGTLDTITAWQWGAYYPRHVGPREISPESMRAAAASVQAPKPPPDGNKFRVGQRLTCRSACDYDTIYSATVEHVGPVMVTLRDSCKGRVTVKIHTDKRDGHQFCFPHGRHSMAPTYQAPDAEPVPA